MTLFWGWRLKKRGFPKKSLSTLKQDRGRQSFHRGLWAERLIEIFMRCKGYKCLARRYHTPYGEIDLVMRKGKILVAVEVKTRQSHIAALESLTHYQKKRISKALEVFYARHADAKNCTMRFDFAFQVGFKIGHIKGAWSCD
tara:strand:+ start:1006 stop:1431 length:426 start_codon:yes stop_codon:yes gene_type:complete